MSWRREATTNAFSVAFSPATKRELFHASKYSDIVGVMTTSAVSASWSVGCQASAALASSPAVLSNSRAAAT